jgi:glycosyltransferase involved in cell wall biosynthesis
VSHFPLSENPLVSIIIPAYRAGMTLPRALNSIQAQTYSNWEAIVVVDGSPDRTLEVARSYAAEDERVRVIEQDNSGPAVARNNGLSASKGELLAFLDADDVWYPEKLSVEISTLSSESDPIGFTYSWYFAFGENGEFVNASPAYTQTGSVLIPVLRNENMVLPSTAMLHRKIYEEMGGFPTEGYHEDFIFFAKVASRYPGYPTRQRLVLYQQSLSGKARAHLDNYDDACSLYLSPSPDLEKILGKKAYTEYQLRQRRTLLYMFLMYGQLNWAKRFFHENLRLADIWPDLKGKLAAFSLFSGINWLYLARTIYQSFYRIVRRRWWKNKGVDLLKRYTN